MKLLVGFYVLIIALPICAQEQVIFEAGGAKSWSMFPRIETDSIKCTLVGNNLGLAKGRTSTRGWLWVTPTNFDGANDYRIEVRMRQINGDIFNGFGVAYGYRDPMNYATFMMSSWNQVKLASVENGKWIDWRDMLQLKCTKPMGQWNTLVLEKINSDVTIKVNDTTVIKTVAPKTVGSAIGIVAHAIMSLEVEYLRLTEAPPGTLKPSAPALIASTLPNATMRFHNILFELGKAEVRATSLGELNQVLGFLRSNPHTFLEIGGHTDDIGRDATNQLLSENRAKAVMNYFISKGIAPARLSAKGYGETKPIVSNSTPDNRQKNRRVEFQIYTN